MTIEMKEYYIDRHGERHNTIIVGGYFCNNNSTSRFIDELIREYNLVEADYYNNADNEICVLYTGNAVVNSKTYEYSLLITGLTS